jgi:Cysteine rich repeat
MTRLHVTLGLLALSGACAPLAAQQLTDAQRSAIKSACRGDYQSVCADVPPGTRDALQCLLQHSQQVSSGCQAALAPAAASPGAASAASSAAAAPAAAAGSAPAAVPPAHPLSPREEAHVLRVQCGADFQKFCSSVPLGAGRGVACLREHASNLTPACRSALQSASPPQ